MKNTIITIIVALLLFINLLPDTLTSAGEVRNPLKVFSWSVGVVDNENGDGTETTPFIDKDFNYIKYQAGSEVGSNVFTVFIYNPLTLYYDDIIGRFDF